VSERHHRLTAGSEGVIVPDPAAPIRLGADIFGQHTSWDAYVAAMQHADRLGYDSLWTPDHVLPSAAHPASTADPGGWRGT
jgi:hypothetical protein